MTMTDAPPRNPERSRSIPPSALHSIHRLVESRGQDVIALHIGEAHKKIPETVKEAFCRAIRDDLSTYCDAPGHLPLRELLCERVGERTGRAPSVEHMFVTPGSCQGISAILLSLAFDGGIALLPEIHWPMHLQQVLMAGLRPCFYSMNDPGRSITESLESQQDPNVCVIIVNSPSNPAGQVLPDAQVREIYQWAQRNRVWIISDEAYEDFVFEGSRSPMGALDAAEPPERRIVFGVRTFSKIYSMTGYRLGFVVAPNDDRANLLLKVQEASLVAPSSPVQFAGQAALAETSHARSHFEYVKGTRDLILPMLQEESLVWCTPQGGWYVLLDLSAFTDDVESLCYRMLDEAGVAVAPGRSFAPEGHPVAPRLVRLAFCRERDYTVTGVRRLIDYLTSLRPA